ncbi:winged helix-turn-helix transcriptional regulator [Jiangella asiatica]|uniref:winged helix-turn-helix transcriptional regulator n=1 Tax=Jiangella asiatica TaxID=2530372 RepID=UPI00193DDEA9|nr:winged helix-turn-helix transcriptional regulator [Jiangella asiatica]
MVTGLLDLVQLPGPHRHVEYTLTPLGLSMIGVLDALCAWGEEHWDDLLEARDPSAAP